MQEKSREALLNLEEVRHFDNLLVFAQSVVDGYFSGRHRAINYGSSAQFKDYHAYQPGDDPSRIDWRLFGRSKKIYSRRYDNETDMVVYLMVDVSASMAYGNQVDKHLLVSRIAAVLTYLMVNQGDKVAVILFDETVREFIPPGGTRHHLYNILNILEENTPAHKTDICSALQESYALMKKRGRLIVLSDFWGADSMLFDKLSLYLHRNFEVMLMQIMDDDELSLPQYDNIRFRDMETGEEIQLEPGEIRDIYQKNMQEFVDRLQRDSQSRRISYSFINTKEPYLEAIEAYLGQGRGRR